MCDNKIFFWKLWPENVDWVCPIPQYLTEDLLKFKNSFNAIDQIYVPICVTLSSGDTFEFQGFADVLTLA